MSDRRCSVDTGAESTRCCRADGHDGNHCPHLLSHHYPGRPGVLQTGSGVPYMCDRPETRP